MSAARLSLAFAAVLMTATPGLSQLVNYEMVMVGNPGNAADTTGYGAVNYEYRIGRYEVTIQQYTDFLNAVAVSDPYGLWSSNMRFNRAVAGIVRDGVDGSYSYRVTGPDGVTPSGAANPGLRPITHVRWMNAARFSNWLHNGQPTGPSGPATTETGAYTLNGILSGTFPARNANALFSVPTENEWYKSAYYDPTLDQGKGGYHTYATRNSIAPGNLIGGNSNQANYPANLLYSVTQSGTFLANQNYLTEVGAYAGSASFYGTYDQSGNVSEWNDLDGNSSSFRGIRGGGYDASLSSISSGSRVETDNLTFEGRGFRLAAPVPEPSTCVMALAGIACGGFSMWRRRKRA